MADASVDVLVVGGGMAGVSIGYELAAHASVLLAETEGELGTHTTGRSAAVYAPSYGGAVVRAVTAASGPRYRELVDELGTGELLSPRTALWLGCDDDGAAHVAEIAAGSDDVREISVAEAVALCPVLRPDAFRVAARDDSASDIDVMALHQGYRRGLAARGGTVWPASPVTALDRDGAGWLATVGGRHVRAGLVVDAAGAWADQVAGLAGVPTIGLVPMRRTAALASGTTAPGLDWPLVADAADRFYFRPDSGRVLVSPADETPSEPCDAKPDELDVAIAIERVNEVTDLGLRTVHTAWAGLRSFVADRAPVVGVWPDHAGFVFFAGQGGYGIQLAPALAQLGAAIALGAAPPEKINVAASDLAPR